MNSILLWAVGVGTLIAASFLAIVATILFRKKMSDEMAEMCCDFIPLECCVLFFGIPFFLCLCFFLV